MEQQEQEEEAEKSLIKQLNTLFTESIRHNSSISLYFNDLTVYTSTELNSSQLNFIPPTTNRLIYIYNEPLLYNRVVGLEVLRVLFLLRLFF